MDEVVGADRVVVLNKGEIVLSGTPKEIFAKKEEIRALGLELPVSTIVADHLKENGIDLKAGVLTEQDLVDGLISWSEGLCK